VTPDQTVPPTVSERAAALDDRIRTDAAAIADERRLPSDLVDQMRDAGVFDMALPRQWGGPELDPITQFEVLEGLAEADPSVAWCAGIGADSGYYQAFFDDEIARELFPHPGIVTAGATAPGSTTAIPERGGWRVSGRWSFGSGSTHADRFVGGIVLQSDGGEVLLDEDGVPRWRTAFLPAEQVDVHDTWDTVGLRGTASNDYSVSDVFVPDEHLFDPFGPMPRSEPLYHLPWMFIVKITPVCTGAARRAIDEAIAIAEGKLVLPEMAMLVDRPGTAEEIARAEGRLRASRAFVLDELGTVWDHCLAGDDLPPERTAGLRLAMAQAAHDTLAVTRAMADLVTTSSIPSTSVIARLLADVTVASTHLVHNHRTWDPLGRRLLGLDLGRTAYI
jgi:alkylation response protein AidB-like acyl-CoA dehydrogenase